MFIFDGDSREIQLDENYVVNGVIAFSVQQLWSRWVDWNAQTSGIYPRAFDIIMVPKPSGGFIGPYLFLRNDLGWVGVPPPIDGCAIRITGGSFYGMDANLPVLRNLPNQETSVVMEQSDIVNTVSTNGVVVPTTAEIAAAVWQHSTAALAILRLTEAWGRLGLDVSKPLVTGQTSITFGDIVLAMTGNETSTTVTRQ